MAWPDIQTKAAELKAIQPEQMSLFEDTENKERRRKLDAAMDEIRMKFGNDKITRASIMNSNARIGRKAKAQMKNEKMEEP